MEARPTKNIEAYDCFQKAPRAGSLHCERADVHEKIVPLLERAVRARSTMRRRGSNSGGRTPRFITVLWTTPKRGSPRSRKALARAERLAPDSYAVFLSRARILPAPLAIAPMADDRRKRIIELFRRAESHLIGSVQRLQ